MPTKIAPVKTAPVVANPTPAVAQSPSALEPTQPKQALLPDFQENASLTNKAPKRSAKPVPQVQSLNLFNIKDSLGESNEIAEAPQQNLKRPSQHFSQIDLEKEWQLFLSQLKTKDTFRHMLIQNVLLTKQDENLVEVEVASEVIQQEFLHIKTEFFNHFAHKVNNHCIEINFKFNETLMVETPNNRKLFDKFAELNPTLLDLDKFLKLDFS